MTGRIEIGYAAALDRHAPRVAVELAEYAEAVGFRGVLATDHFQPWLPRHGESSFVWSVLAAMGERTMSNFGPGMAVPGYRYHPAILAQAAATTAAMYPGRHWVGIGSGEALNEHVAATYWPEAPERVDRMFEAIDLIRRLFAASIAGRDTKYTGTFYRMESTRLWTMPEVAPSVLVATSGPQTAHRAGKAADGVITLGTSVDRAAAVLKRFGRGVEEAGRDPAQMLKVLHLHLSWAVTQEEAVRHAVENWPVGAMRFSKSDIRSPRVFEQMARHVNEADFEGRVLINSDPDAHRRRIQEFVDLGFDRIYLNNVGPNQHEWLAVFGAEVLPNLR